MSDCPEVVCCPNDPFSYSIGGGTVFYNTRQCATAYCPDGETGDPKTDCVEAGLYSRSTQAEADAAAFAAAYTSAQAMLSCSGGGGGCSNSIPQMTSDTTPLGLVFRPNNMTAPVGFEDWRSFTIAGEYRPDPFSSGPDAGQSVGAVGYQLSAARKISSITVQYGPMNNGQTVSGQVIAYPSMPAGFPGAWNNTDTFPGGGTVIGNFGPVISSGAPITFASFDTTTLFTVIMWAMFSGGAPPWNPVALKGLQICGST